MTEYFSQTPNTVTNMNLEYAVPVEIWHIIFSRACIDDGSTGRSLSLVSTYFREISAPFKYQSVAVTHWSQIVAFSHIFCKLPASQKKILSLFVYHPYPFLNSNHDPSRTTVTDETNEQSQSRDDLESSEESEDIQGVCESSVLPESKDGDDVLEVLDVDSLLTDDWVSDSESDSNSLWDCSDGVWDSEFEGSLDSEEEREILEDTKYLQAVRDGLLPPDGTTRDDVQRDAEIQEFFNNVLQAFHAILNETSSTLQLLAVYWTSFKPLQTHKLLPPLPCLKELHINRSSILNSDIYEEPPTTVLFPQLSALYISGDNPRKLSFSDEIARIAPNLASLRFSMSHFHPKSVNPESPKHNFYFHLGGIIIENDSCNRYQVAEKRLKREFGEVKYPVDFYLTDVYKSDSPEAWQKWWMNQMVGNDGDDDDGPWNSPNNAMRIGRVEKY